jgi:phosphatidylinositol glycan class O
MFSAEKQPWMDKLQVLQKLAADEKKSARIFKALADPPTTSLQRLKVMKMHCCVSIDLMVYIQH